MKRAIGKFCTDHKKRGKGTQSSPLYMYIQYIHIFNIHKYIQSVLGGGEGSVALTEEYVIDA